MKPVAPELIPLYDALQKHTFKDCKKFCDHIAGCCTPYYCERTKEYAERHGVELPTTGHPTLLYMGENGCTVAPHLRPECTAFVCCIVDKGGRPSDPAWTAEYYRLVRKIRTIKRVHNDE